MNDLERFEEMQKSETPQLVDENCIKVKNIPDTLSKEDIYSFFKGYGYIKTIFFPKVPKGSLKYCYVEFKDHKSVDFVCKERVVMIKKQQLMVSRKKNVRHAIHDHK